MSIITPPVGMNLFVIQGLSIGNKMKDIVAGVLRFGVIMALLIVILCFVPELATWLPQHLK